MFKLLEYSGIVTKVRAMQGSLLKNSDYEVIANLRTVPDVVSYLKTKNAYNDIFENISIDTSHRGNVEKTLDLALCKDYQSLYKFANAKQRSVLKLYLKHYEIDLINYCFRIVINHYNEPFDLNYKKVFYDKYSKVSIEKLITSRTMDEIIDNLKDTEYYAPLSKLKESKSNLTLFDYDLALNLYYFTSIWKMKKKILKGKELKSFTNEYGSEIDLLNLQWILRCKKYFKLKNSDIYDLIIPIYYRLSLKDITSLVESETIKDFDNLVDKSYYGKKYNFNKNLTMERMAFDCLSHLYTIERKRNPYSISSVTTYLFLKEEEIRKIITALECIRYNFNTEETLRRIGGVA